MSPVFVTRHLFCYNYLVLLQNHGGPMGRKRRRRRRRGSVAAMPDVGDNRWRSASPAWRFASVVSTPMMSAPRAKLSKNVLKGPWCYGILAPTYTTQIAPQRDAGEARAGGISGIQCLVPGPATTLFASIGGVVAPPTPSAAYPATMTPDCPLSAWVHHACILP